jgi:hypothetical protein
VRRLLTAAPRLYLEPDELPNLGNRGRGRDGPGDYDTVDCPGCGMYEIASMVLVESRWSNLTPERRREALDKAQRIARAGERPRILTYMLPP